MAEKILVTGATGGLGREVVRQLAIRTDPSGIVAFVRDEGKAEDLKPLGVEIRTGNYDDPASLRAAFRDVDKLYFVSGSDVLNRMAQHERVIRAAGEQGVRQVYYTSIVNKNPDAVSSIDFLNASHLQTEAMLKGSGMAFTILRHNIYLAFIYNLLGEDVLKTKTIFFPAGEGKTAFVARDDMAEAGAILLLEEGHENRTYDITHEKAVSFSDVAARLSEIRKEAFRYVSPSREEYIQKLSHAGVPPEYVGIFAGFAEAFRCNELDSTSNLLENVLGRKPLSLTDYLKARYER
ncbi:MAG: SDR family oxidoreductase [Bacteroidales bacterium]